MSSTPKAATEKKLAEDFKTAFKGRVADEVIASVGSNLANAQASYPAIGSIASIVIWMKCQCTVKNGGKTFDGSSWGIAFPGGGALIGDVYTDDINALYANTVSFALTATPVYTAFYFFDKNHNALGSFQAGSVSTVSGTGGGSGSWS